MSKGSVTIVGSGLIGSLLTIMLAQRGYQVSIFEKRPDPRIANTQEGRSINLALAIRGIYPLEKARLMDKVYQITCPVRGRMLHSVNGEQTFQSYGLRDNEMNYSISRSGLNICLINEAEKYDNVKFYFDHQLQTLDLDSKQVIFSHKNQQLNHDYETLFGADGANSSVRKFLIEKLGAPCEESLLDHGYKELYLQADNKGDYVFREDALHIWPRGDYMLMALPNLHGSFTLTLYLPYEGATSFESLSKDEAIVEFFDQNFSDLIPHVPDLTKQFKNNPVGKLATVRCYPWHYQDSVLLLGDAAHAIVPFHGQGMNCGFEDCHELIRIMSKYKYLGDCFELFSQIRKPNTDAIAAMALENYVEMRDGVTDALYQLKREVGLALEQRYPKDFIPRYSMVMYHRMPYKEALERGKIQDAFLDQICKGKSSIKDIDFSQINIDDLKKQGSDVYPS